MPIHKEKKNFSILAEKIQNLLRDFLEKQGFFFVTKKIVRDIYRHLTNVHYYTVKDHRTELLTRLNMPSVFDE